MPFTNQVIVIMGKRGAVAASPMKKKLKKSHPVNVSLGKVEEALVDVEIPGTKVNRKMLMQALPLALGDGASADERHAYQTVIVDAIGEVMSAEVKKCTESVAAAQAELDTTNTEKAGKDAVLAEKQKLLEDKKAEITSKKEKYSESKHALKDAEHALKEAVSEVDHFDGNMQKKEKEKAEFETHTNITLARLISGEFLSSAVFGAKSKESKAAQGKGIETLKTMLGDAGADDSLVTCFHAALGKAPDARGAFDNTVIGEVEKRMKKHIASLGSELAAGPTTKEEKQAAATKAEEKKTACIAAQEASAEALKVAESEKPDLDAAVKTATHDVKEIDKVQDVKVKKLAKEQSSLDYANQSYEAWKYLAERPAEAPEEEKPPEEEPKGEEEAPMEVAAEAEA